MTVSIIRLLLSLLLAVGCAEGFTVSTTAIPRWSQSVEVSSSRRRYPSSSSLQSSKEEEIAELERRLQQLKQEAAQGDMAGTPPPPAVSVTPPPPPARVVEDEETANVSEDFMLSEKWKESQPSEGGGGGLMGILGAVGLAVALAAFSQVPIGQENYSKYAAIDAPKEQIDLGDLNRARSSTGDL